MDIFLEAHLEVLNALVDHQVDFILVGGYAVNFYGYNRVTGDLDLWLRPDNANKTLLVDAMEWLGFEEEGLATIRSWNFAKSNLFSIMERPFQVEFMTHITGVEFSQAKEHAAQVEFDGLAIKIIHLNDLIKNKTLSGRTKDLADVEYLNKIKNRKDKLE